MINGVYQIVNLNTKKFYIGSAKDLETRYGKDFDWTNHHNTDLVAHAMRGDKYLFMIIQECASHAEALCMEQWWLDFYVMNDLWDCLYNKNKCVWKLRCDITGIKRSQKTKDKISAANTGKKRKQETKNKISAAQKIIQNKPEVKAAKSAAKTGKKASQEARNNMSAAQAGKKKSQVTKDKMSAIQKVVQNQPEIRASKSEKTKLAWKKRKMRDEQA